MSIIKEKKIKNVNKPIFKEKATKTYEHQSAVFSEKSIGKKRKDKERKISVKSSFTDVCPIVDITQNGYFQLSDEEGYFDIIQLTSTDIYSLNDADKDKNIYTLAYFLQWYLNDIKIVPLNFPVDTSSQQAQTIKYMEKTLADDTKKLSILQDKLNELKFIESEKTNREYYMFVYADDEYTLRSRVGHVDRLLQQVLPIIKLTDEKKVNILYKLFNLNSKNTSI